MTILQFDRTPPGGGTGGVVNNASNVNVGGVGVFKQLSTDVLEFRGIISGSNEIDVSLDAVDNEIVVSFVPANVNLSEFGGSIDLGGAQASGTIAEERMPALTGAISTSAGSTVTEFTPLGITGADIANNTIGNGKLSTMAARTIKGNSNTTTGNSQDMTLVGGVTTIPGSPGSLKVRNSIAQDLVFNSSTAGGNPGLTKIAFNSASWASITSVEISSQTVIGRDIDALLATGAGAQLKFMSNTITSLAYGIFDITAIDNNGTGEFYTFTVTPVANVGIIPANNEEILIEIVTAPSSTGLTEQDVLDMRVLRRNASNQIIDELGNVMSGSPVVTDYTALIALDETAFDGFAVNIQTGHNNAFFASNGTAWGPVNGQYICSRSAVPSRKYVSPANVTWTAADNGSGKVRLESNVAHSVTFEANLYMQTNGAAQGTGWTSRQDCLISAVPDATHIDLDVNYTIGMGVPVFCKMGTLSGGVVSPDTAIRLLQITLPEMRLNSKFVMEFNLDMSEDATASAKRMLGFLENTLLYNNNMTAAGANSAPYRWGFKNQGDPAVQRGIGSSNGIGYGNNTEVVLTAAVNTAVAGKVFTLYGIFNSAGMVTFIDDYDALIRG